MVLDQQVNNMNKLKIMKVLDVQWGTPKMPDNVKEFFFDYYRNNSEGLCNDVWVEYCVGGYDYEEGDEDTENNEINILDLWLLENTDVELGEEILLKHWW